MHVLTQYKGVFIRPDNCAPVQLVAPGKDVTTADEMKSLSNIIDKILTTLDVCLNFTA